MSYLVLIKADDSSRWRAIDEVESYDLARRMAQLIGEGFGEYHGGLARGHFIKRPTLESGSALSPDELNQLLGDLGDVGDNARYVAALRAEAERQA